MRGIKAEQTIGRLRLFCLRPNTSRIPVKIAVKATTEIEIFS